MLVQTNTSASKKYNRTQKARTRTAALHKSRVTSSVVKEVEANLDRSLKSLFWVNTWLQFSDRLFAARHGGLEFW